MGKANGRKGKIMSEEEKVIEILKKAKDKYLIKSPQRQYKQIRYAIDTAVRSIEKQIPKKVYYFVGDDSFEGTCCGIDLTNKDYKYCPQCGNMLGEVEEVKVDE